jgi:hypothetical protein
MSQKKLPLITALVWILLSIFFISGLSYGVLKKFLLLERNKKTDAAYQIRSIVQTGPQKEALKTGFLAELMSLSRDRPANIYSFDEKKAERDLLRCLAIRQAKVKCLFPGTLYVDYTLRQPLAALYNYENIVFDEEGYLYPLLPFFPPKNLPMIYLSEPLQNPLRGKSFELALSLLTLLNASPLTVRYLDISNAFAKSYGQREIVLLVEDEITRLYEGKEVSFLFPRYLRLSIKNYAVELGNYLKLRQQLLEKESRDLKLSPGNERLLIMPKKVIDLRIPELAFIKE